jgi:TPR repeat protein
MYATGKGVSKDDKQAVYWYQKAAAQENTGAQYNLGSCLVLSQLKSTQRFFSPCIATFVSLFNPVFGFGQIL